jgi:hypothetical protein
MTSTIERAVHSFEIAWDLINELYLKSTSQEEKENLSFLCQLILAQRNALITYIECIKDKRRQARHNKKANRLRKNACD